MAIESLRSFANRLLSTAFALLLGGCAGSTGDDELAGAPAGDHVESSVHERAHFALVGAGRPATVPADFVVTPAGYMHPSCIVLVSEEETARADGSIERADGRVRKPAPCRHPRYDSSGQPIDPSARPRTSSASRASVLPAISGWVESAHDDSNGPLNWISANWTVPQPPLLDLGQTLFWFPGIQPIEQLSEHYTILQPVLRWNQGVWTIESWNCCVDGNANVGPAAVVNSGDTLYGYVEGHGCDARGVCSDWFVHTGDWTTGAHSWLNTSAYGNVMGWAFGGVLEVYGVEDCDQYPSDGSVSFSNIQVRGANYLQVYPDWNVSITNESPQCNYGVDAATSSSVTVYASPD